MVGHAVAHMKLPISGSLESIIDAFPGVPIFFVVSGFLITGSYLRHENYSDYLMNRAFRIYPALWVNLVGITILLALLGSLAKFPDDAKFWFWHLAAGLLGSDYLASKIFGGIFSPEGAFAFYPSGVLWTLPVEIGFYLLLPVIISKKIVQRVKAWVSLLLWGTTSLACLLFIPRIDEWVVFSGLYLWIFLLGSAARLYWPQAAFLFKGTAVYWIAVHLLLTWFIVQATGSLPVYVYPGFWNVLHTLTLAGSTLACAFTAPRIAATMLNGRDMSYGLYLWHMPVISLFMVLGWRSSWSWFALAAVISFAIAYFSMKLIEMPALKYKDALKRKDISKAQ